MTWNVPGYTAERLLGRGSAGEVWRARDQVTGAVVALKRLRVDGAELTDAERAARRARIRREGALLAAFQHPGVIRLRGLLGTADGAVLVLDLAAGGSLAQVLAGTDRLRCGEVVGALAPMAEALAAAHDAGLVHGDVSPGNVLFTADGTPLLADLGTARIAGETGVPAHATAGYADPAVLAGAEPTGASDVYGLAAVTAHALVGSPVGSPVGFPAGNEEALTGAPVPAVADWAGRAFGRGIPAPLVAAVVAGLDPEPARRPSAAAFGSALRATCDPVRLSRLFPVVAGPDVTATQPGDASAAADADGDGPALADWWRRPTRPVDGSGGGGGTWGAPDAFTASPPPAGPRRWPRARRASRTVVLLAVVLACLVLVAGVAIVVSADAAGHRQGDRQSTSAPPAEVGTGWHAILTVLDARRAAAFAAADPRALAAVYLAGSEPLRADRIALGRLTATGFHAVGLRHEVRRCRIVLAGTNRVALTVTDRMPDYRLVGATSPARLVRGRGDRTFHIDLARTAGGWRIAAVTADSRAKP